MIQQASPQVIYVPAYNPVVVYGPPIYPYPSIYYPPAGYYAADVAITRYNPDKTWIRTHDAWAKSFRP